MSLSKRHHYNPRYYLKRFQSPEGLIWRLDIEDGSIVAGSRDTFGLKSNWNTLEKPPTGYAPDWAEQKISEIDSSAASALKLIDDGCLHVNFLPIACAISFMQLNQPRLKLELENAAPSEVRSWSRDHWLVARIQAGLNGGPTYVPTAYSVLKISSSDGHLRFLSSSNPLIEMQNLPTKFFPMSSRKCLVLSYDPSHAGMPPQSLQCDEAQVRDLNRMTLKNAWKYVYSETSDFQP